MPVGAAPLYATMGAQPSPVSPSVPRDCLVRRAPMRGRPPASRWRTIHALRKPAAKLPACDSGSLRAVEKYLFVGTEAALGPRVVRSGPLHDIDLAVPAGRTVASGQSSGKRPSVGVGDGGCSCRFDGERADERSAW